MRSEQGAGQRDCRVGHRIQAFDLCKRVGDHLVQGNLPVHEAVDERGIGAVFEQSPHQIGEQFFVRAHRGVDADRRQVGNLPARLVEQQHPHAVQALEFERGPGGPQGEHRGHRMRVMGRELRVDARRGAEQLLRAGEVGHVGRALARIDRIARQSALLCPFDLAVPVSPFHESDGHPAPRLAGEAVDLVDHSGRAQPVGLDGQAEALPVAGGRIARECADELQREFQAVLFLGVDRQREVMAGSEPRQFHDPRQQALPHALLLQQRVAGLERRELDRDGRRGVRPLRRGSCIAPDRLGEGVDRAGVGLHVAPRIGVRPGPLAEHVEGTETELWLAAASVERIVDVATDDEFPAQDLHRAAQRFAHHGLAGAAGEGAEPAAGIAAQRGGQFHEAPGEHQRPGGGIDEQGAGPTGVRGPVAAGEAFRNQLVRGVVVGHPQQRLGQAHQRDALRVGQSELLQEGVERGALRLARARAGDDPAGLLQRCRTLRRGQGFRETMHDLRFVFHGLQTLPTPRKICKHVLTPAPGGIRYSHKVAISLAPEALAHAICRRTRA